MSAPLPEKPLHVQVAEALTGAVAEPWHYDGVQDIPRLGVHASGRCSWALPGAPPPGGCDAEDEPDGPWWMSGGKYFYIPRYDTDWSATGPLIERYGINLQESYGGPPWKAGLSGPAHDRLLAANGLRAPIERIRAEGGETPLVAACNLILALHAAGKLPK